MQLSADNWYNFNKNS